MSARHRLRELGRLSYSVYILHVIVMAPIAIALVGVGLPAILKYPILALATYAASNLVAYGWTETAEALGRRPTAEPPATGK